MTTVAGTGHRPHKLGIFDDEGHQRLVGVARGYLSGRRPSKVISGMALGFDQALAEACIIEGIPFVAAVPFPGQEEFWSPAERQRYTEILGRAASVETISPAYGNRAYYKRDAWMVDHADEMAALWNGMVGGGTAITLAYAEQKGVPVTNLWVNWLHSDLLGRQTPCWPARSSCRPASILPVCRSGRPSC